MAICKYYSLLYTELEHPGMLVPVGSRKQSSKDAEGQLHMMVHYVIQFTGVYV